MNDKAPKIAFLVFLFILIVAFSAMLKPFLFPLLFAALVAVISDPVYQLFYRLFKRRYIASAIATLIVSVGFLLPLGIVAAVIIANFGDAVNFIMQELQSGRTSAMFDRLNLWIIDHRYMVANIVPEDLSIKDGAISVIKSVGTVVYQYSPKVISATANILGGFLLTIVFIFIFFAEGGTIYRTLFGLLPLEDAHKQVIASEIRGVVSAVFLGQIATSVAQGVLIGFGFWLVGINNPVLWGLVAMGVTLIPVIGGPLMYLPAVAALVVNGNVGKGILLFAYGVGIVSTVDNIIKPLVMRGKVNVHPVMLALSLIGGGLWLGPAGIIVGPLVVVLLLAMLKIYAREFR